MNTRGYAVVPRSITTDADLTDAAFRLYVLLDQRQGASRRVRVGRSTLAADLGWSLSKVSRALVELLEAGLLEHSRTGRTSSYSLVNPERRTDATRRHIRSVRAESSDVSDLTHLQSNKSLELTLETTTTVSRPDLAPAVPDPLALELLLEKIPATLRPDPNRRVQAAAAAAFARGWTPDQLANQIAHSTRRSQAGPGLTVTLLEQYAAQPPTEYPYGSRTAEAARLLTWAAEQDSHQLALTAEPTASEETRRQSLHQMRQLVAGVGLGLPE